MTKKSFSNDLVLDVRDVTKRFGGLTAVNNVSLQIKKGMIASLIGPNGAGKTTFFNNVTGFYTPDFGAIYFMGHNIAGLRTDEIIALGIARTYQNIHLFHGMTALENILAGMHTRLGAGPVGGALRHGKNRHEEEMALVKALDLLEFIDLGGMGDFAATNLSYGAQRRAYRYACFYFPYVFWRKCRYSPVGRQDGYVDIGTSRVFRLGSQTH